jgi:ABC-type nitrate/sulfonate/bicarbonate transport system substrate-binding protein
MRTTAGLRPPIEEEIMRVFSRGIAAFMLVAVVGLLAGPGRAAGKMDTITYGLVSWNPLHWVVMVGVAKGLFEKHNIKLDIPLTGSSGAAMQAMLGGSLNMTTTSPGAAFLAQDKASDMKQIIGIFERTPYSLVVSPEVKSIGDLKGKVMGGTGVKVGADTETMRVMLHHHGFEDPRDYTVAAVGSVRERTQALLNKTIWGVAQMEPFTSFLKDKGMVELTRAADYPDLKLNQIVVVVSMKPWYTAHEDVVVRFLRGWAEATDWLYDPRNKAEAIKILAERMKIDEKYAANTYRVFVEQLKGFPAKGKLNMEAVQQAAANMKVIGGTPPTDIAKYVDLGPWEKAFGR